MQSGKRLASWCQMCYIEDEKGKARDTRPTLDNDKVNALQHQPFTIRSSGRLFSFPEDCITQTYESNNEYTKLDQIRICNHWHRPPFFRLEG